MRSIQNILKRYSNTDIEHNIIDSIYFTPPEFMTTKTFDEKLAIYQREITALSTLPTIIDSVRSYNQAIEVIHTFQTTNRSVSEAKQWLRDECYYNPAWISMTRKCIVFCDKYPRFYGSSMTMTYLYSRLAEMERWFNGAGKSLEATDKRSRKYWELDERIEYELSCMMTGMDVDDEEDDGDRPMKWFTIVL